MFRRIISTASIFVGAIVGAGFATGKEISVYFGKGSIAVPIIAGVMLGVFCFVFMLLGRGTDDVLERLFGRCSYAARVVIVIANFVIFATMIAGAELIFCECFGVRGIGIVSGIAAIVFVGRGTRLLSIASILLVPVIVGVTLYFALSKEEVTLAGELLIIQPIAYAAMNVLTGGYLVAGYSREASVKECLLTSILVGIICCVLLVAVYIVVRDYAATPMPLFYYAQQLKATIPAALLIFAAIFTTMITSLKVVSGGCYTVGGVATAIALLVSIAGFGNLVTYCYPVIGYIGCGLVGWGVLKVESGKLKVES